MGAPVEVKVKAGTAAAAVSGLVLWVLGQYVFKGTVPAGVTWAVYAAVPAVLTFAAGWAARHTSRPAESPAPVPAPPQAGAGPPPS